MFRNMKICNLLILYIVLSICCFVYFLWLSEFTEIDKFFVGASLKFEGKLSPKTGNNIQRHSPSNIMLHDQKAEEKKSHKKIKSAKCNYLDEESISGKPMFDTDPERFIVAISHNGPTNQLMGLRDAIFLSVKLNRTLILPKFLKVNDDPEGNEVPAEYRFNVESLSKMIKFKKNNQLKDVCSDGIQQLVTGRECSFIKRRYNGVKAVVKSLHLPFPVKEDGKADFVCSNGKRSFGHIVEQHNASSKCIAFCFYGIGVTESPPILREADKIMHNFESEGTKINATNASNRVIYSLGVINTGLPSIVKKLAKGFVNEFMNGGRYLAIHWRYNPGDWMMHCRIFEKKNITSGDRFGNMCYQIKNLNPEDLVHAGLSVIDKKVGKDRKIKNVTSIYLATPLNQKPIIDGFEQESVRLRENGKTNLTFLTSTSLQSFLNKNKHCIRDKSVVEDTLALVEMELCIQSAIFLHSVRSSWSENVIKERRGKIYPKFSNDILSLAWQLHQNATNKWKVA